MKKDSEKKISTAKEDYKDRLIRNIIDYFNNGKHALSQKERDTEWLHMGIEIEALEDSLETGEID